MSLAGLGHVPVPSPAVLRFLRIQAESLSFLASQKTSCWTQSRRLYDTSIERAVCTNRRGVARCAGLDLAQASRVRHSRIRVPSQALFASNLPRDSQGIRNHSTNVSARRWYRPWSNLRKKPAGPLQPTDLPPPSLLDDSASLGRIVKPLNELQLRCTEFDGQGNVTLINGAFKKSELIAKVCLFFIEIIARIITKHIKVRPSTA